MSIIPKKKKIELEDNVEEKEDIYASFNKTKEEEEEKINKEIASQFNHDETSVDNKEEETSESDVQEESTEEETTNPFEKKYKTSLEENTKVTSASKASRFLLFGFYLLFILLGGVAFLMIRGNKYEFYLKNEEVAISTGSSYQVELIPKDIRYFDYFNYNYSIADESIATVDEFGTVTAKAPGTTTLKISLSPGFTSKTMKIVSEDVGVESLDVKYYKNDKLEDADSLSIRANESITLKTVANNQEKLNITSKYHSSDTSVAVVDDFGNVTGKSEGKVTISSEVDGVTETITIDVKKESEPVVPTPPTNKPTDKPTIAPTVKPTLVPTNKPVTTPTNKPTVAPTVKPTVKATVKPTVKPTVAPTIKPTVKATVKPTVKPTVAPTPKATPAPKVTSVSIGIASQTTKYVGETLQLSATVEPSSIKGYTVNWSSNNTSVATVLNGKVTCIKAGTAVITAEVNGVKASSTIVVKNKVTPTPVPTPKATPKATPAPVAPNGTQFSASAIQLDKTSLTVDKGKTATFKVTLTKAVGSIKVSSSNTSVVKVDLPVGDPDAPSCNKEKDLCFLDAFKDPDALTFTVTGVKAGTAYINIVIDDIETVSGSTVNGSAKVGILVK